ncbi:MAG TPA: hypothetical protein VHC22_16265 [Pirellulales bacterium]|nr:hypothetical protein [Pirellulales bacterium]
MMDNLYFAVRFISLITLLTMAFVVGGAIYLNKKRGIPLCGWIDRHMISRSQSQEAVRYRPQQKPPGRSLSIRQRFEMPDDDVIDVEVVEKARRRRRA